MNTTAKLSFNYSGAFVPRYLGELSILRSQLSGRGLLLGASASRNKERL